MSNLSSDILTCLLSASSPVSGESIAENLHVSRAAVWKAIQSLRSKGYPVTGSTKTGYILEANDILSAEAISIQLQKSGHAVPNLVVYSTTDSTNHAARELASNGAPSGTTVLADMQTSGRGRYGRSFASPAGTGLYISVILRPDMPAAEATFLTTYAAVCVAKAVEAQLPDSGLHPVKIKWVNDLYLHGKKICGILTEAAMDFESGQLDYAVVGIGVNVNTRVWPPELQDKAGDIQTLTGESLSRNRLAADIISSLLTFSDGSKITHLKEYRDRSCLIGHKVRVLPSGDRPEVSVDRQYEATVLSIDDNANLVVKDSAGHEHVISSGEVSLQLLEKE